MSAIQLDMASMQLRDANRRLHEDNSTDNNYIVSNPRGAHALACGVDAEVSITIDGHVGYYCAGMNQRAQITVQGNAGQGVAENMMSGRVHVQGDTSQSAGATAHGGLLVIDGNASARCGISLKGADIVVKGNVGHMSMFMAQLGTLVVLGDAGDALGDSIYEANIFVRGSVSSLGTDCEEKEMTDEGKRKLTELLNQAGCTDVKAMDFHCYGSARTLYHFQTENLDVY